MATAEIISAEDILFDEESHHYTYENVRYESVTQKIRAAGFGEDFSTVSPQVMEAAQRRGRQVHSACQFFDEEDLNMLTVPEGIMGYVQAYLKFLAERPLKVVAVEQKMVSPGLELAGTPDLICFMGGRRAVVDRKTSQIMSKSMGLQTAGYKILWNRLYSRTPIYDRFGLRLGKDGNYKLMRHEDPDDEPCFWDILEGKNLDQWRLKYGH